MQILCRDNSDHSRYCVVLHVNLSSADIGLQWERLRAELFSASASAPRTGQVWPYVTGMASGPETAGKIFTCGKCSEIFISHMDGKGIG